MATTNVLKYFWLLTVLNPAATIAQSCYAPPKGDAQNGTVQPFFYTNCNVNQAVSMCCRTQVEGGDPADVCLPNGLCSNTQLNGGTNVTTYWRESCTDPTWKSSYCINIVCGQDNNYNAELTRCPNNDTQYCCGGSNTQCCGTASAIPIAAINGPFSNTPVSAITSTIISTVSSVATSTIISTSTSAPTALNPRPTSGSGLSTGAKAGIGVSIVIVVIAVALSIGVYLLRRKKSKEEKNASVEANVRTEPIVEMERVYGRNSEGKEISELQTPYLPPEFPAETRRAFSELDCGNRQGA